jgi:serine/threonine-protein kinase
LPGLGDESKELANVIPLRMLMGAATGLMLIGAAVFLFWSLTAGSASGAAALFAVILVLAGALATIVIRDDLAVPALRWIERAVFATVTVYLAWMTYRALADLLATSDVQAVGSRWNLALVQFVLLLVIYGVAVPNAAARAARSAAGIAAAPVLVAALLMSGVDPGLRRAVATPARMAESLIVLGAAAVIAALAAYVIDQYLSVARTTRISIRYLLKRRLGIGGMGEVWLAEHNLLARPAAVKLVRGDMIDGSDPDKAQLVLRRFEREARATAKLRSAHTVEIYDFGVVPTDGTFYYAMEYLDGIDLSSLVKRHGPVPAARVVYLLAQACQSLSEAHSHGMTHRDIKPQNVFICRMGTAHDFVKVLDFGLVTTDGVPSLGEDDATGLTLEGQINGTPGYMAPELVQRGTVPDHRADLYALGCVGYFLLTGRPVFEGPPLSVLVDHVKTDPLPPSQAVDATIPVGLEQVILRCLEKDPAARFGTAHELAEALLGCCVEPVWNSGLAADWWRLHLPAEVA